MSRWLACMTVLVSSILAGGSVAVAQPTRPIFRVVSYVEPIDAPVVDPFRPPAHVGAPGNRGLEYGNDPGQLVVASADGFVTFAGSVAGVHAITIHHPDNVRTSYTGLALIWVAENTHVRQGDAIGRAETGLHFGARSGRHYLDPHVLLEASQSQAQPRLVPLDHDPP